MGGFDDHVAVMGDWMPPSPNLGSLLFSMMNDDVLPRSNVEFDTPNRNEQQSTPTNADKNDANFEDKETVEPNLSSRGGLKERIAARAGFNAPWLNTESIKPADISKKPDVMSPYLTIPPGLSPTTLLDSPVFLSNSLLLRSPTTGKFPFLPSGDYRDSPLMVCDSDKGKENTFNDVNASSFAFKPIDESASFPYFSATNKSFPSAGFTIHPQSVEPTKTHLGNNDSNSNSPHVDDSPPPDEQIDDGDLISNGDPNSGEDAYNWRKYGQKPVKGSEFPRSYYRCTHPHCPMKKKVERSQEGHITAIIYKGTHNHKIPPNRRSTLDDNLEVIPCENGDGFEAGDGIDPPPAFSNNEDDEDQDRDGEGDESEPKRRRIEEAYAPPEMSGASRPIREPRVVVQTTSEVDILDDGYRWRKYGQKVVKGNPNPRSYYKCTTTGCNVRKHVERAAHDLNSVITTYEGKHTHDVPAARNTGAHPNPGGGQTAPLPTSANANRPEPSRTRAPASSWFDRPPLGSFTMGSGRGYGYVSNQRGLAGLGFVGIGCNQEKLGSYLGNQTQTRPEGVGNMGYMIPKGDLKFEPVMEAGLTNGPSVYQQLMNRLPLGPEM